MDNEYWEQRLMAYIDKELDPADHAAVKRHIEENEECRAQYEYFCAMKGRLRQHHVTTEMPAAVDQRLRDSVASRHRFGVRMKIGSGLGFILAAAAALMLFLAPQQFSQEPVSMVGTVVCYDCEVAAEAGMEKMSLCSDGQHQMGLKCHDGSLWRIARDKESVTIDPMSLYGQEIEVQGQVLVGTALLRLKEVKPTSVRQAAAF